MFSGGKMFRNKRLNNIIFSIFLILLVSMIVFAENESSDFSTDLINLNISNESIGVVNTSLINETSEDMTNIILQDNSSLGLDKEYYLLKYNLSEKKSKKITLTNLKNLEEEQKVIIEFDTTVNMSHSQKVLKGKRNGRYISKSINKKEILDLLSDKDVVKIWSDRKVNITVNDASLIVGATSFHSVGNGNGVKVCILDTGAQINHSMLLGHEIITTDFTGEGFFDGNGHGTHVTTTLAGSDANYTGIAPGVILYLGKVLDSSGSGYLSWVMDGMDWCIANNVSVISMSLGATYSEEPEELLDAPEVMKVKEATQAGIVVVIAAGNSGEGMVTTPGISPDAITVGAVTKLNQSASFSGWDYINGSLKPDLVAPGVDICAGWINGYNCLTGTSMSTPIVAGLSALLIEKGVTDVKGYLLNNSVDIGLNFKLAHINLIENDNTLPQIRGFNVYTSGFVGDGAIFALNINNSNNISLFIDNEEYFFNSSFSFNYYPSIGVHDYSIIAYNEFGNATRSGNLELKEYKLTIPNFNLYLTDTLSLIFKNINDERTIPISIMVKNIDEYISLNEDRIIAQNETANYNLDFTPSLPGKYKVLVTIENETINTTLKTSLPLMAETIGPMKVKMR